MTDTYRVLAKRWDKGWELHIAGVGVTQARRLHEAEVMVRDLVHRRENIPPDSFAIEWDFELNDELNAAVRAARAAVFESSEAQVTAAAKSRAVAVRLRAAGLQGNEVAKVLGVSPQRASQLLRSATGLSRIIENVVRR